MSNVSVTVDELIGAVKDTYRAIDIRSVAIRNDESWLNVLAAIRFTYEDVDTARARLARLSKHFPALQTDLLRLDSCVRPFGEWPDFRLELCQYGVLRVGELEFKLRQQLNLDQPGWIQSGDSRLRPFDGQKWPAMIKDLNIGGNHPLLEGYGQFSRAAHLADYADPFEAANALCEINVSSQSSQIYDLSLSFPIFADISAIQIDALDPKVSVEVMRHRALSDIRVVTRVRERSLAAEPPCRHHITLSKAITNETQGEVISARYSTEIHDLDPSNDWLEVRLSHPKLGEVKRESNDARMFIPAVERNILLEALKQFCRDTTLDDLLSRAYNVQQTKVKPSAAFELHVSWLLGLFGFSTVVLGEYEKLLAPESPVQRASIDILAADQRSKLLLIVSCTLNPPKEEDVGNLRYAREILAREVFSGTGVAVVPVLFTSAVGCPPFYQSDDQSSVVSVIDADGMKTLFAFLESGRESRLIQFLTNPTLGLTDPSETL